MASLLKQMKSLFANKNKINFIFLNLPMSFKPNSKNKDFILCKIIKTLFLKKTRKFKNKLMENFVSSQFRKP